MHCTWPRCPCKSTGIKCASYKGKAPPKKSINRVSEKGKQKTIDKKALIQNDMMFYLEIWSERPKIDYETNEKIEGKPKNYHFHHVLEKANYPEYRHKKWNIVLVNKDTHDNCHSTDGSLNPKIHAYRKHLLELHERNELINRNDEYPLF